MLSHHSLTRENKRAPHSEASRFHKIRENSCRCGVSGPRLALGVPEVQIKPLEDVRRETWAVRRER